MGEHFGAYIRRQRGERSRKKVAEAAGITFEYLRLIEKDGRIPKEDKVLALAKALNHDPKDLMKRALTAKNEEAATTLLSTLPRFPRARDILAGRLTGPEAETVRDDLDQLTLAPQERPALHLWAAVMLMETKALEPAEARQLARERIQEAEFVEGPVADYIDRNLVSWEVDPETGRQKHQGATSRVQDLLNRMAGYLDPSRAERQDESLTETARQIAELLEQDEEFAALFHNFRSFSELSEGDKADIVALWELAGRLVNERQARKQDEKEGI